MCHRNKTELAGTGALAYIEWGEAHSYHNRPTFRNRLRWYDLGRRETSQLAINYLIGMTTRTFFTESTLFWSDNFQLIRSKKVLPLRLCVAMNTTLSQLMFNIEGRVNFGGGLLKIQAYETQNQTIVNPSLLPLLGRVHSNEDFESLSQE